MADTDRRGDTLRLHPVYRKEIDQIVIGAAVTAEVTTSVSLNAIIGTVVVILNDTTNSVTATLQIRDVDGAVLYSSAGIVDNFATVFSNIDILVDGDVTIGITPSGAPGASTLTADIRTYVV
jgi:hypothetical protein